MARRCAIIPFDRNPSPAAGAVPQRWPRSRRTPWGYCGLRPEDATSIGRSLVEPRTTLHVRMRLHAVEVPSEVASSSCSQGSSIFSSRLEAQTHRVRERTLTGSVDPKPQ
jgi:hypothetical protein